MKVRNIKSRTELNPVHVPEINDCPGKSRTDGHLNSLHSTAVHFLMHTFRNILYVRVGKRYVRSWRLQRSRTVTWGSLRWDGSWKTPTGAGATPTSAAHTQPIPICKPNPNLNQWPPRALSCLKLDNSCCYAHRSCGNNCNVVVKLVLEYHSFSSSRVQLNFSMLKTQSQ